jgi:putative hydrolase of the HAD superfamily
MLPDPVAFRARLARFGVNPDDETCRRAHYLGTAEIDRQRRADYARADRAVAAGLGVRPDQVGAAAHAVHSVYMDDPFVPIDGVGRPLRRLHDAGIRLGIVSNATGAVADDLARHRICAVEASDCAPVDVVVDSHVVGVEKPDPAIFALALDAIGLPVDRCVYLGDSEYFDVGGAQAAGIRAVHVTPYAECVSVDHAHVHSVLDFVDRLLGPAV